jgi:hypothetical protein
MFQNIRVPLLTAISLAALALPGCNKGTHSETAKRAEQAGGETVYRDTTTATVEAIDLENRIVTLREEEKGSLFTVEVGEGVPIDRMQTQDRVNVAYQESLAFALQEPGSEPTAETEATTERLPDGVQFGRRVTTTVEILAIAPEGTEATFRDQEGEVRTVEVEDPRSQEKVSHLRPGDTVEVTYTERLALELAKEQEQGEDKSQDSSKNKKGKGRSKPRSRD